MTHSHGLGTAVFVRCSKSICSGVDKLQGKIRRVVTGHNADGKSILMSDGLAPSVLSDPKRPGRFVTQLWVTDSIPVPITPGAKDNDRPVKLEPPRIGAALKIVELPPATLEALQKTGQAEEAESFSRMGAASATTHSDANKQAYMHRTSTFDYGIVLDGEAYLILDETEVLMRAGDVIIQDGTNHSWSNRSDKPCRLAFFMMGGEIDPALSELF